MRARMDDEQRVAQRLQVLRDPGFVEFIGQRRIKEVQPPDSPEAPFEEVCDGITLAGMDRE